LPPPANILWKIWKKYGKIWHRGNFSPKVVIYETGCGNFPWKNLVTLAPLHLHSKQSRKLARSCLLTIFCFPFNDLQIKSYSFKSRSWILCFGMIFFIIEWLEEVNMATWTWKQMPYTSICVLLKTVINEEQRDMRMKCKLKFILYASNFPSYVS
jgi:hypothetical protein